MILNFLKKFIERACWFLPMTMLIIISLLSIKVINETNILNISTLLFSIYLLPPLLYRISSLIIPIKIGTQKFGPKEEPSGWMVAHRIQMIYMIIPFFERALNSLPEIYSIWLRLWGSKIGRMVYWAPDVVLLDRTHLNIGSHNFIGGSKLSSHIAIPRTDGSLEIVFEPIHIGSKVFIATQCNIGPGTKIKDKEFLKIMTQTFGEKRKEMV